MTKRQAHESMCGDGDGVACRFRAADRQHFTDGTHPDLATDTFILYECACPKSCLVYERTPPHGGMDVNVFEQDYTIVPGCAHSDLGGGTTIITGVVGVPGWTWGIRG